jgi:perosamine synthetase
MRTRYSFEMLGYNYRLTDVAAAIGLAQLAKLDGGIARRRAIAAAYDAAFADLPLRLPVTPDGRTHVFHQYTVDVGPARDAIIADIRAAGVGADIYYPVPVHRQAYILERGLHAELPVTDAAAAHILALPVFPGLTDAEQTVVVDAVRSAVLAHAADGQAAPAAKGHAAAPAPEVAAR